MHSINEILQSDKLPSLPEVALKIIRLSNEEEPDLKEIGQVIQLDPALSACFLKISNSVLFASGRRCEVVDDIVIKLGIDFVQSIALSFYLRPHASNKSEWDRLIQKYWWRSITQACVGEELAHLGKSSKAALYFQCGLLQDLGILALVTVCQSDYAKLVAESECPDFVEQERAALGLDHVEVGSSLFEQWGMNEELISAMQHHHTPLPLNDLDGIPQPTIVMRIASLLTDFFLKKDQAAALADESNSELRTLLERFGLDAESLPEFLKDLESRVFEVALGLEISIGDKPSCEELLNSANNLLANLAVRQILSVQ